MLEILGHSLVAFYGLVVD